MTKLYIVGTPIGNLGDISKRAIESLEKSDVIFAEDTRTALALLNHLELKKKVLSYHKDNEQTASNKLIECIKDGNIVALVSEAGMPCISDPGAVVIKALIEHDIKFEIVQGPVALLHGLIASGFAGGSFYFHGFLPHKTGEKVKEIAKIKHIACPIIFYESPHRIKDTVTTLLEHFDAPIAICRELTKRFEETAFIHSIEDIDKITVKGEFVVVVDNSNITTNNESATTVDFEKLTNDLVKDGLSQKDITKVLKSLGMKRNDAYKLISDKMVL